MAGEIPAEKFEAFRRPALTSLNQSVTIDGFRLGRAPEPVLRERLGETKILEAMAELALRDFYPKILEEKKIDAIGQPRIEITKLAPGNPLGFKITTAIYPCFTLPDYRAAAATFREPIGQIRDGGDNEAITRDKRRVTFLNQLIEKTAIPMPAVLREAELDKMIAEMQTEIQRLGLKFNDYLKQLKKTEEELRREWLSEAEKRVKSALILEAIAAKEQITAPAEAVEVETKRLLELYPGANPDRARAYIVNRLTNEEVFRRLESLNVKGNP